MPINNSGSVTPNVNFALSQKGTCEPLLLLDAAGKHLSLAARATAAGVQLG
jgi:hypothetical protein